jgi:hypothetical protein
VCDYSYVRIKEQVWSAGIYYENRIDESRTIGHGLYLRMHRSGYDGECFNESASVDRLDRLEYQDVIGKG